MNNLSVSIIIPTFNRNKSLFRLFRSIKNVNTKPKEILVVVQSKKTLKIPREFTELPIRLHYLQTPNMTRARNVGAQHAKGKLLLFLDDDVLITSDLIKHVKANFFDVNLAATVGRVLTRGQSIDSYYTKVGSLNWLGNIKTGYSSTIKQEVDSVIGCNMCWRKDVFMKFHGMDEQYTGNALREETDLSIRVSRNYKLLFDPNAEVIHLRSETGGARKTEGRMQWYYDFFSNETYYFLKHRSKILLPIYLAQRADWALRCMFGFGREVSKRSLVTPFLGFLDGIRKYRNLKKHYAYWR